jgi:cell division protein ZapA (FtsZ GTPase activity inhibitor)
VQVSVFRKKLVFEGIGQIEIEFLGKRFVIGCIEGEEDRAIMLANNFEIYAGEALKAVTGDLDHVRAMLMAGVLTNQRIEELENENRGIPASDRIVSLDHNSAGYLATRDSLETLILVVRESNSY